MTQRPMFEIADQIIELAYGDNPDTDSLQRLLDGLRFLVEQAELALSLKGATREEN